MVFYDMEGLKYIPDSNKTYEKCLEYVKKMDGV
jgi:hypothetical protein